MSLHFTQCCPTCGRRVRVRANLLGSSVGCQHCQAEFVARAETRSEIASTKLPVEPVVTDPLMARVEELLAQSSQDPAIG
jgi:hypothetical protein